MANPYRSSEGLSARPVLTGSADEVQLRIDPVHADLDDEILSLQSQVSQLKNVAQEIESEAKYQNDLVSDLQRLMSNAEAGVKNGMKKLNRTVAQHKSNHILQVIVFGLMCFAVVYLWTKVWRR
ncbi:unnamed protein product [Linum tenue]|uniref:t-SNARE coiled-coil homology domain-containing protein n=1 Tax=Linum tenue TaxID=586396 RepID=A0AAV0KKU1_9ROSI|nr:unnamed protein product [Linum tenue]